MINLRSDTQTLPTNEMLRAMAGAELGDDTYREDPTVIRLEERVAELFARDSAMLLFSGTMGNLVSLMVHCRPGDEFYVDSQAHVVRSEAGGYASIAGLAPAVVDGERGHPLPDALRTRLHHSDVHRPNSRLLWLENTHNRAGGSVMSNTHKESLLRVASQWSIVTHLDGARLFNASVALDMPPAKVAEGCDSVLIDLTKGLSCPSGALLIGDSDFLEDARHKRRMVGGGMRQAGIIAAAGLIALDTMVDRIVDDHTTARWLATQLRNVPGYEIDDRGVETNIVFVDVSKLGTSSSLVHQLRDRGLLVLDVPPDEIRMVTHRHIGMAESRKALEIMKELAVDQLSGRSDPRA